MAEPKNFSLEIANCLQVLAKSKYVAVNDCQTPLRVCPVVQHVDRLVEDGQCAKFRVVFSHCDETGHEDGGPQEYEDVYEIVVTRKHLVKA
jgi:hypothetical protein